MAKINTRTFIPAQTPRTHEGAVAYDISAEKELQRSLMACMLWEDTFYEDGKEIAGRIYDLVQKVNPIVAASLAITAREQMKLRHIPLWVARALAAGAPEQRRLVGDLLARVIQRPDELTEFLALYWKEKRQPLSAQVKRGLARAFQKFDAYGLAKYDRAEKIKLRDVLFLSHAKPRDETQAVIWKQLVEKTLPIPDTWEVGLSAAKTKEEKLAVWTRLITEGKLGALAYIRNLRNMEEVGVSTKLVISGLEAVNVSRVLPFRFVAAARYAPKYEPALESLMLRACKDLPKLTGKTVLLVDGSGSMNAVLSTRSEMTRFEAASALAILLREICENVIVMVFSNKAYVIPARRGFALRDALRAKAEFSGTYTETAKRLADTGGYDRIIIVTDEQSHESISAPHGKGYVVNVASYQHGIGYGPWTHVDGWSEAIVSYIAAVEGLTVAEQEEAD